MKNRIKQNFQYLPYGYRRTVNDAFLGFVGELLDRATGCYLLGAGHRSYSPVLMRFFTPDSISPFEAGGLNAYVYCESDPVNWVDPTGRNKARHPLNVSMRATPAEIRHQAKLENKFVFTAADAIPLSKSERQSMTALSPMALEQYKIGPHQPYVELLSRENALKAFKLALKKNGQFTSSGILPEDLAELNLMVADMQRAVSRFAKGERGPITFEEGIASEMEVYIGQLEDAIRDKKSEAMKLSKLCYELRAL